MTLEEAIKLTEQTAIEDDTERGYCYLQIAGWLKELKRQKTDVVWTDKAEIKECMVPYYKLLNTALDGEKITQRELARRTKLTPGAISMLCSGTRQPTFDTARVIASALSCTRADYWMAEANL